MSKTECEAERVGLKVGNTIFLVAGTRELICRSCKQDCPYTLCDYSKQEYQQALPHK